MCSLLSAIVVLSAVGWQYWNGANTREFEASRAVRQIDLRANAEWISGHPLGYCVVLARTIRVMGVDYARQFVGTLASLSIPLPSSIVLVYVVLLAVAASMDCGAKVGARARIICGAAWLAW